MEYPLPQFLEIKPKVAGPFNLRQIIYIVAGATISIFFYLTFPLMFFVVITIPIMIIAFILAFAKIKGFPVPTILVRSFRFLFKNKQYVWHKTEQATPTLAQPRQPDKKEEVDPLSTLKITEKSRLKEVAKLIEIHSK
jgi:hypothetical protein